MIPKCGELRTWHWAHRGMRNCDPWWESETEWHRAWKNCFPAAWQERVLVSASGEKHVADVQTSSGVVLEFQHSPLHRSEREAREGFYQKMAWIVDGLGRTRDAAQFLAALRIPFSKPQIFPVSSNGIFWDWGASRVPVYFDFGESGQVGETAVLWRRDPYVLKGVAYFSPVPKASFLRAHREEEHFEETFSEYVKRAVDARHSQASGPQPLRKFERYMAKKHGSRRRF